MKVLHVNAGLSGGAAIAARRLHDSLAGQGVESRFLYPFGAAPDPTYVPYATGLAAALRAGWQHFQIRSMAPWLWGRRVDYEIFSDSRHALPLSARAPGFAPDVLHLHWTAGFLAYRSFFASVPAPFPVVWTLHDMHAFTGGCHYSFGCERFTRACGSCPQLGFLRAESDPSRQNFLLKRDALRGRNLHVVADSRWLEGEARRSAVLAEARSFRTIHYGVDVTAFSPKPRTECRRALGLAQDAFIVCFGAQTHANRRKGMPEMLAALGRLRSRPRLLALAFGDAMPKLPAELPPVRSLGALSSADALATAYGAADVFVIPSLAEAFGQTALEAMACARPVVGFDTGGIPDMVIPGRTGLLACAGDPAALAESIGWMDEHPGEREEMGHRARAMVEAQFTLDRQAQSYGALYRSIAGG